MSASAEQARTVAAQTAARGDLAGAARILYAAAQAMPGDPALANSAGNAAMRAGLIEDAINLFSHAARIAPDNTEYSLNLAIALTRAKRPRAALATLAPMENLASTDARYCSVRATAARDARRLAEAGYWYDQALRLQPAHARARHGRARVAMERAEPDAVARYDHALAVAPHDPELWLGKAQALDAEGRSDEAAELTAAIVQQAPQWLDAVRFQCQLRLAQGETDFSAPFRAAAAQLPDNAGIPAGFCEVLAGLDQFAEAAQVAADAARRYPEIAQFQMLEAAYAGAAGDDDRAERIWQHLALSGPERALHEARHWLRRSEPDRAEVLLEDVLAADATDVSAWAFLGIAWRMRDDPRADWLHEQVGLVQLRRLADEAGILPQATQALHKLHDKACLPLSQSLRGGTQTRGGLFDRHEPVFATLRHAVCATLDDYRSDLPSFDPAHPLLRYRDSAWSLAGSWSVRMSGGGEHHAAHIHPQGILSSALYLDLPDDIEGDEQHGWLELGRPPADLRLDLPPLRVLQPKVGYLALFPSTLYHATRPFSGARRMTVAFDVNLDMDRPI